MRFYLSLAILTFISMVPITSNAGNSLAECIDKMTDWSILICSEERGIGAISSLKGIEKYRNINRIDMYSDFISDLSPLSSLSNLQTLSLRGVYNKGKIQDIRALADLTNLKYLDLSNNQIIDITPLSELSDLEELILDHNKISDVKSLAQLKKLKRLSVTGNNIRCDDLVEIILQHDGNLIVDSSPPACISSIDWSK